MTARAVFERVKMVPIFKYFCEGRIFPFLVQKVEVYLPKHMPQNPVKMVSATTKRTDPVKVRLKTAKANSNTMID